MVATCPSGKTWNRVRCSPSLSSPILVFHLVHFSLSKSLASTWCVFHSVCFPRGVSSARCVFRPVCLHCSVCLLTFRLAARCFPLVACLTARTPTLQLSPTHRWTDPNFVQKGPGFNHSPFAACLPLSIHHLRDSGVVVRSLG